ncbi:UNVERIFIED_CONTAM: hypothetical protein K2H54_018584 [Gekko kuhli]
MSAASKAVLGVTVLLAVGTVAAVHIQQSRLREASGGPGPVLRKAPEARFYAPPTRPTSKLREGVLRDIERQNRKEGNLRLLKEEIALTKQLEMERDKMLMAKGPQQ